LKPGKKIYFASDFHLGAPSFEASLKREKLVVRWLEEKRHDAAEIYLVGDVFDMWFEYKRAVPPGHTRLLGKIAEITDSGIPVHWFTGNHDMWIFKYLPQELNVQIHREAIQREYGGKKFYIAHGDGLGPGDHGYKFIKKFFASKFCQWCFARLHPNLGLGIANRWSQRSRSHTGSDDDIFLGEDKEFLVVHGRDVLKEEFFDYFIFGHRHLPLDITLQDDPKSRYVNLGDWISYFTYAEFDGTELHLKEYLKEIQG
jgi:UDP-2,3-diacylglucosamine hydrolase